MKHKIINVLNARYGIVNAKKIDSRSINNMWPEGSILRNVYTTEDEFKMAWYNCHKLRKGIKEFEGIDFKDVCKRAGVNYRTIERCVNDLRPVKEFIDARLCKALGIHSGVFSHGNPIINSKPLYKRAKAYVAPKRPKLSIDWQGFVRERESVRKAHNIDSLY